jgi:hypothetical protein
VNAKATQPVLVHALFEDGAKRSMSADDERIEKKPTNWFGSEDLTKL